MHFLISANYKVQDFYFPLCFRITLRKGLFQHLKDRGIQVQIHLISFVSFIMNDMTFEECGRVILQQFYPCLSFSLSFIQIHLFVCNEERHIEAAFAAGATGVMTDYPTLLSDYIRRQTTWTTSCILDQIIIIAPALRTLWNDCKDFLK